MQNLQHVATFDSKSIYFSFRGHLALIHLQTDYGSHGDTVIFTLDCRDYVAGTDTFYTLKLAVDFRNAARGYVDVQEATFFARRLGDYFEIVGRIPVVDVDIVDIS